MAKRVIAPPAALVPRNDNERPVSLDESGFPYDQLKVLSCFEKTIPDAIRNFPQSMIVRFFRKGEDICHQDDPGYTAFYILKREEIKKLSDAKHLLPTSITENWNSDRVLSVRKRFYGRAKRQGNIAYLSEGEIFGEMSCLRAYLEQRRYRPNRIVTSWSL